MDKLYPCVLFYAERLFFRSSTDSLTISEKMAVKIHLNFIFALLGSLRKIGVNILEVIICFVATSFWFEYFLFFPTIRLKRWLVDEFLSSAE